MNLREKLHRPWMETRSAHLWGWPIVYGCLFLVFSLIPPLPNREPTITWMETHSLGPAIVVFGVSAGILSWFFSKTYSELLHIKPPLIDWDLPVISYNTSLVVVLLLIRFTNLYGWLIVLLSLTPLGAMNVVLSYIEPFVVKIKRRSKQ